MANEAIERLKLAVSGGIRQRYSQSQSLPGRSLSGNGKLPGTGYPIRPEYVAYTRMLAPEAFGTMVLVTSATGVLGSLLDDWELAGSPNPECQRE